MADASRRSPVWPLLTGIGVLAGARVALGWPRRRPPRFPARTIAVSGRGEIHIAPDEVYLSLGVRVTAPTAQAASREAANTMTAIIAALQARGVPASAIQTTQFSLTPEMQSSPEGRLRRTGHTVSNVAQARVTALDTVGLVIDDALNAGGDAVTVNHILFASSGLAAAQNRARTLALEDARTQADLIARAMGVTLGEVQTIRTAETGGGPPTMMRARMASLAATPIEVGELAVTAAVEVVFAIK
jgi:uncharacterized protein YggE